MVQLEEKCTHLQRDVYKDLNSGKKTHAIAKAPHNVILTNIQRLPLSAMV